MSIDAASDRVRYEREGHVATITYDRPEKLNAIDGAMRAGLNAAFDRFRADDEAWVGIVRAPDGRSAPEPTRPRRATRRVTSPARSGSGRR